VSIRESAAGGRRFILFDTTSHKLSSTYSGSRESLNQRVDYIYIVWCDLASSCEIDGRVKLPIWFARPMGRRPPVVGTSGTEERIQHMSRLQSQQIAPFSCLLKAFDPDRTEKLTDRVYLRGSSPRAVSHSCVGRSGTDAASRAVVVVASFRKPSFSLFNPPRCDGQTSSHGEPS
jgi:hypothetical protein